MLKGLFLAVAAAALASTIASPDLSRSQTKVSVERLPVTSGRQMYDGYCAPCHGTDGRGRGPVAHLLRTAPPDLTQLSLHNKGKYPENEVVLVLEHGVATPGHGMAEMPVWGPALAKMNHSNNSARTLRIYNLSRYLEQLQQK
ncbi:MAG: c-type cytochrome [Terracidiphilus sp.]